MNTHPNASVAAIAGAAVFIGVWLAGVFGLSIPAEVGAAATTLVTAGILFIGRRFGGSGEAPNEPPA